ncbi:hypothetical protein Trisim1_000702 [Trichoderma cf. simile WF8]
MSWFNQKAELDKNDRELLTFSVTETDIFLVERHGKDTDKNLLAEEKNDTGLLHLRDENEMTKWVQRFQDLSVASPDTAAEDDGPTEQRAGISSSINLIMGGKTSSLSKMPLSEDTFSKLMSELKIHRSIIRAINRNTSCTFSRMMSTLDNKSSSPRAIFYTCRTTESWDDDMALSVTFFPDTLSTNAIWFGCNLKKRPVSGHDLTDSVIITDKLRQFDGAIFHPMMLPTIFAEFERDRHVDLVRKSNTQFMQRMIDIESQNDAFYIQQINRDIRQSMEKASQSPSRASSFFNDMKGRVGSILSGTTLTTSSIFNSSEESKESQPESNNNNKEDDETCAMLWIQISHLKNGLENWKTQLRKMLDHIQELEDADFGMNRNTPIELWTSRRDGLKECGERIRERLRDLVDEYDDFIRECDHVMAGMSLATQLTQDLMKLYPEVAWQWQRPLSEMEV